MKQESDFMIDDYKVSFIKWLVRIEVRWDLKASAQFPD